MNLTVNQAVWLAAAMMTYERFNVYLRSNLR
jgi:hypothetical protein